MRFNENFSVHIDFPGIKGGMLPEKQFDTESFQKAIVINAFPIHPYDYPQIPLFLDLLEKNHNIIKQFKEKYNIADLFLLINKKWKKDIRNTGIPGRRNLSVLYKKPLYPVTNQWISAITRKVKCRVIGWYDFYKHVCAESNQQLPGIPISLSHPVLNKRVHTLVPTGTLVRDIAKAADIELTDSVICTNHPFRGVLINPETKVIEQKPHTLIFFPKNIRKNASLWLKFKFMVCGYCSFVFTPVFDSHPLQFDTPCQKCLYCTKICPVGIVPLMLSALYTAENIKEAIKHSPELCIECGLCSYICPSGIPLLHNIKRLKKDLGVDS